MRCPNCGAEVGESPFCPSCGADTTSGVRRRRRFIRGVDAGARRGVSAAVLVVAAVCVLAVVLSAFALPDSDDVPAEASLVVGGSAYIVFGDRFEDGVFTAEVNSDGNVVIALDPSISAAYDTFTWELREDVSGESMSLTKGEAWVEWMDDSRYAGSWTVTVYCSNSADSSGEVLTGSFLYRQDAAVGCTWVHGSVSLSVSFTVTTSQYVSALSGGGSRGVDSEDAAVSFVDAGGAVADLERRIWSVYSSHFSESRTSADYADCLIGFVSACVSEQSDLVTYGASVHWASPTETLYMGVGDSGDIAVLAASLLAAAGFDAGVASLPGEWVVVTDAFDEGSGFELTVDGVPRWVTSVVSYTGLGEIPSCYGFDGGLTYYGAPASYAAAMY